MNNPVDGELVSGQKLREAGYSQKAIVYYLEQTNVGKIDNPSICYSYEGPCGDTITMYLKIRNGIISDAKFMVKGCPGAYSATSALTEMIRGKKINEAKLFSETDIIQHLEGIPESKRDCIRLAKTTFEKTINTYSQLINYKLS